MEKRHRYRQSVAFQARVTAMANPGLTVSGETLDISESGIGVCLPLHLTPGSLVQLEIADSVLYGFVAHSLEWSPMSEPSFARNKSSVGSGPSAATEPFLGRFFRTGIEVVEVLIGTSGLSQLLKANFEERMPSLQMTYSGPVCKDDSNPPSQKGGDGSSANGDSSGDATNSVKFSSGYVR